MQFWISNSKYELKPHHSKNILLFKILEENVCDGKFLIEKHGVTLEDVQYIIIQHKKENGLLVCGFLVYF